MFVARIQDQLATNAITAMGWCAVSANGEGLAYRALRGGSTAAASFSKIAHRGSFSGLCVTKPARLGNPEDTA
jgi:hypothetical protein